jgi:membrane protein implicated in regulation of membrane protease activity
MTNPVGENESNIEKLLNKYDSLEKRISLIEARLGAAEIPAHKPQEQDQEFDISFGSSSDIEVRIGSQGLAWLGNIVMVFGIMFLMTYAQNLGYSLLPSILGYLLAGGIFLVAYKIRKSLSHMDFMLNVSGYILAFYVTLRLHFFTPDPVINQFGIGLAMILIVIAGLLGLAIRKKSEFLVVLSIVFLIATALFSGVTHVTLALLVLTAATSVVLFLRKEWRHQLIFSLFLVYLSHLVWLMGNPILGNPLGVVDASQNNLVYLFAYAAIYAFVALAPGKESIPERFYLSVVIWNAILFLVLVLMVVLAFYEENYAGIFTLITIICLVYSVILYNRGTREFIPALFACFGFMAMSVSVYGYTGLPNAHLLLALQSLLVMSMALWYRSKIIVVVNTMLYILILLIYMIAYPSVDSINIVFALVALASARILNWQKERLTLRTEVLRNLYLIAAFFMVLFSLKQAVPVQYVTLSWTLAAAFYLVMNIILNNIKYRWMAISTFIATAIYLFAVDLASLQVGYRVVAFLFLAAISITASVYYTKRLRKKNES